MKKYVNGTQIDIEPNSKPYLLKRFVADGFDILLIFALFMLFTMVLMKTPLADTYHLHFEKYEAIESETAATLENDAEAISSALSQNNEYRNELFAANLHGYLLKAAACLIAELLVLLVIPFLNVGRATPGKLLTGILPFNEKRQSRVAGYQILYRFLYVFLVDSLALYLFTGILTFLLVPMLRLTEMLLNKKNKTICDWITGVMMIEKLSYTGLKPIQGGSRK